MENEIKEVYVLAVNCIITALVLAIVAIGLNTRNSFASARNNQTAKEAAYSEYVKYGVYKEKDLIGDEVITLIREYYDQDGMTIYVDRDSDGNEFEISKEIARQHPDLVELDSLKNTIDSTSEYKSWLVYDFYDIDDFVTLSDEAKRNIAQTAGTVTGIVLIRQ